MQKQIPYILILAISAISTAVAVLERNGGSNDTSNAEMENVEDEISGQGFGSLFRQSGSNSGKASARSRFRQILYGNFGGTGQNLLGGLFPNDTPKTGATKTTEQVNTCTTKSKRPTESRDPNRTENMNSMLKRLYDVRRNTNGKAQERGALLSPLLPKLSFEVETLPIMSGIKRSFKGIKLFTRPIPNKIKPDNPGPAVASLQHALYETETNGFVSLVPIVAPIGQRCDRMCSALGFGCAERFQQQVDVDPRYCVQAAMCRISSPKPGPFEISGREPSGCIFNEAAQVALSNQFSKAIDTGCLANAGTRNIRDLDPSSSPGSPAHNVFHRVCICDLILDSPMSNVKSNVQSALDVVRFSQGVLWQLASSGQTCTESCEAGGMTCFDVLQKRADTEHMFCTAAATTATNGESLVIDGGQANLSPCDAHGCVLRVAFASLPDSDKANKTGEPPNAPIATEYFSPFIAGQPSVILPHLTGVAAVNSRGKHRGCDAPAAASEHTSISVRVCACNLS